MERGDTSTHVFNRTRERHARTLDVAEKDRKFKKEVDVPRCQLNLQKGKGSLEEGKFVKMSTPNVLGPHRNRWHLLGIFVAAHHSCPLNRGGLEEKSLRACRASVCDVARPLRTIATCLQSGAVAGDY